MSNGGVGRGHHFARRKSDAHLAHHMGTPPEPVGRLEGAWQGREVDDGIRQLGSAAEVSSKAAQVQPVVTV